MNLSYQIETSIGIALRGQVKRARHKSLTVGCIEFDLSCVQVIESNFVLKV